MVMTYLDFQYLSQFSNLTNKWTNNFPLTLTKILKWNISSSIQLVTLLDGFREWFLKIKNFFIRETINNAFVGFSISCQIFIVPPPKILVFNCLSLTLSLQADSDLSWDNSFMRLRVYTFSFFSHFFCILLWTCKVFIYLPHCIMSIL